MVLESPLQPESTLERQLEDVTVNIELDQFQLEVRSYLENLKTQARGILKTYEEKLNTAPIETLEQLKSLIAKLKHVAKTKEIPPEDNYQFKIEDTVNPYYEAFTANNLPVEQEITLKLDLKEVLESDLESYQQAGLEQWAQALPQTFIIPPESRKLIGRELKEGAIPIFMPPLLVQQKTLLEALTSLKPIWIKEGVTQTVNDPFIWSYIQSPAINKNLLFITYTLDKPYILLVKPNQKVPVETTNKTLDQQIAYLTRLQQKNPNTQAILPQEYGALQAIFTQRIHQESLRPAYRQGRQAQTIRLTTLDPLDKDTSTRFITLPFPTSGGASCGCWDPDASQLKFDRYGADWTNPSVGFRLAVRAELEIRS